MIACINDRHCEERSNIRHCEEFRRRRTTKQSLQTTNYNPSPRYRWLVTGGAGFIGSHIVERLLKDGHFVRVLDNFSSGRQENLDFVLRPQTNRHCEEARSADCHCEEGQRPDEAIPTNYQLLTTNYKLQTTCFELIRGDIRDYSTCVSACRGIDYILHQAALRSVPKSMKAPHDYNAVNIDGSLNILEAALKTKVKRVVLASSSSVYGNTSKFPEKETDLPLLISPYALTKLAAEYYSRVFSENYGLETVNLRYFNVFGPRQALDDEYAVVIPKFITCMLNNEQPPIYGNGKQSRDFTYVDNVVEANILAATTPLRTTHDAQRTTPNEVFNVGTGEANNAPSLRGVEGDEAISKKRAFHNVFNVGTGQANTILDLVDTLNQIMDKDIKPLFLDSRPGDVFKTHADISKIKSKLGYEPTMDFESGLKKTVEWFDLQQILNTQYAIRDTRYEDTNV